MPRMARDCPPMPVDFLGLGAGGGVRDMMTTVRDVMDRGNEANGHVVGVSPRVGNAQFSAMPILLASANGGGSMRSMFHLKDNVDDFLGAGELGEKRTASRSSQRNLPGSSHAYDPPTPHSFFAMHHWLSPSDTAVKADAAAAEAAAATTIAGGGEGRANGNAGLNFAKDGDKIEEKEDRKRPFAAMFDQHSEKPLEELTDVDIQQLTREECRKYLKQKGCDNPSSSPTYAVEGMRKPSWNKAQVTQQLISLKGLLPLAMDSAQKEKEWEKEKGGRRRRELAAQKLDEVTVHKSGDKPPLHPMLCADYLRHMVVECHESPDQRPTLASSFLAEARKSRPNLRELREPDRGSHADRHPSYICTLSGSSDLRGSYGGRSPSANASLSSLKDDCRLSRFDLRDPLLSLSMRVNADEDASLRASPSSREHSPSSPVSTPRQQSPTSAGPALVAVPPLNSVLTVVKPASRTPAPAVALASPLPAAASPMPLPMAVSTGAAVAHTGVVPQRPSTPSHGGRQRTAQLTIFYDGIVNVYDDVPADKARAIMLLAGTSTSWPTSSLASPNPLMVSSSGHGGAATSSSGANKGLAVGGSPSVANLGHGGQGGGNSPGHGQGGGNNPGHCQGGGSNAGNGQGGGSNPGQAQGGGGNPGHSHAQGGGSNSGHVSGQGGGSNAGHGHGQGGGSSTAHGHRQGGGSNPGHEQGGGSNPEHGQGGGSNHGHGKGGGSNLPPLAIVPIVSAVGPATSMLTQSQPSPRMLGSPAQSQFAQIPPAPAMRMASAPPVPPVPSAMPGMKLQGLVSQEQQKAQAARMSIQHAPVERMQVMSMPAQCAKEPSQARSASLARYLEKRKGRMCGRNTRRWGPAESRPSPQGPKSTSPSSPSSSRGHAAPTMSAQEEISSSPPGRGASPVAVVSGSPLTIVLQPQRLGSPASSQPRSMERLRAPSPSSSRGVGTFAPREAVSQDSSPVAREEKQWSGKQTSDSQGHVAESRMKDAAHAESDAK